ncbi:MAG: hypothetical protein RL318_222 [Fibrobacterota bacterium]|jgi:ferredoxin-nitrite reductase
MSSETPSHAFDKTQRDWLEGFLAAAGRQLTGAGEEPCPYPAEASAGYRAQTRWLASGKRLAREEQIKRRRNPLLFRARLQELDAQGQFPEGEENFLARFHGIFNVAPTQARPMCRLRIPGGIVTAPQAQAIASAARDCGDGLVWLTTRSNVQIREIREGQMDELLVRLEEVGLGARGSGADNLRNIVGNPTAGIDPTEILDVRPLVRRWNHHVLNQPDLFGLPRKFNVAFEGGGRITSFAQTNDISLRAVRIRGVVKLSLGLGGITGHGDYARETGVLLPLDGWLWPLHRMLTVYLENGNRGQRGRSRLKYLLEDWGVERFLSEVQDGLPTALERVDPASLPAFVAADRTAHFGPQPQKQRGRSWLGVHVPVGKLTAAQFEGLARIAAGHGDGDLRLTVWQNLLLSGLRTQELDGVTREVEALGLSCRPDGLLQGLIACTGSEGCKHGQAATKATALAIETLLAGKVPGDSPVNVHITGCPHSCAQHLTADIGLIGTGLELDGIRHDAFHIALGGVTEGEHGIAEIVARSIPAQEVPKRLETLLDHWLGNRTPGEGFEAFVRRVGLTTLASLLA